MNLSEVALSYEGHTTKNIAELDKVEVIEEIHEYIGEDFSYYYIERDDVKYRVPKTVLIQLKEELTTNKELKYFKVKKSGEGLKTQYMVIPFA